MNEIQMIIGVSTFHNFSGQPALKLFFNGGYMFLLVYYFSSNDVAVTLSFDSDRLSLIGQNIKDTKLSIVQLIFQFCMVPCAK